jgi:hypothetical protein
MKARIWIMSLIVCFLWGCPSSKSPFQATWYLVEKDKQPEIYVAILNLSPENQFIADVILNQRGDARHTGWRLNGPKREVEPGEVLLRPITRFSKETQNGQEAAAWHCRVPVNVVVVTGSDSKNVQADMIGGMPSSVPDDWERECPKH